MSVTILWLLNILIDSSGQLAFKQAALNVRSVGGRNLSRWRRHAAEPLVWIGIACFSVEFVLWLAFLSLVPLSRGVLLSTINIVVIVIAGRFLFAERLSAWRVTGILLIVAGVAAVGLDAG